MHAMYLTTHDGREVQLAPNAKLFNDGGIAPDGRWWIAPTSLFIEQLWQCATGDYLKKLGFQLGDDGLHIGATQSTVIYLPVALIERN